MRSLSTSRLLEWLASKLCASCLLLSHNCHALTHSLKSLMPSLTQVTLCTHSNAPASTSLSPPCHVTVGCDQVSWPEPATSSSNGRSWYACARVARQRLDLGSVVLLSERGQQFGLVQCMWEDAAGLKQAQVGGVFVGGGYLRRRRGRGWGERGRGPYQGGAALRRQYVSMCVPGFATECVCCLSSGVCAFA